MIMHRAAYLTCLLLATLMLSRGAAAQSACTAPSADCMVVGEWNISLSLGLGQRSNPVAGNSDIPLLLLPQISYYGKRFFLENLELGFTLHDSDANTLSLIAAPGYDRIFFYRNDLQNYFVSGGSFGLVSAPQYNADNRGLGEREYPVRARHTTYLVGPEWTFNYGRLVGQVDALYEVTGRHQGYEVRAALATALLQAEDSLTLSAGLTWKSAALVRYYYGIERLYQPGSALNPFVKLAYSKPLSPRWAFNAFAHYEYLGAAIADSPIVSGHGVTTVFAGIVFKIL